MIVEGDRVSFWYCYVMNLFLKTLAGGLVPTSDRDDDTVHTLTPTWHPCSHLWEHQCYISLIPTFESSCHLWMLEHRVVSLLAKIMSEKIHCCHCIEYPSHITLGIAFQQLCVMGSYSFMPCLFSSGCHYYLTLYTGKGK